MTPDAVDTAPVEDVAPVEDEASEEIVVWGRLATEQARDAIVHQLEDLGWDVVRRDEGRTVLRGPRAWMGRAELDEDGAFSWTRPLMGFTTLPPEAWAPPADEPPDPNLPPPLVGAGPSFWILPSRTRLDEVRASVLAATQDEVDRYREVRRRTIFEEQLQTLPERLDRLWSDGEPLEPGPSLPDPAARRRVVLEHWASRADTPEGGRAAEVIGTWLAETVQTSPWPITDEERAAYRRPDGRVLP